MSKIIIGVIIGVIVTIIANKIIAHIYETGKKEGEKGVKNK